jgi:hypothetical protein
MKKILAALLVLCGSASLAHAQSELLGMDTQGNLFSVDTQSGAGTLIGTLQFPGGGDFQGYNEIVFDPATGRAFAQERDGNFRIQEFNPATAQAIGQPVDDGASWHALEYINGTLYGIYFAGQTPGNVLATLDPETGVATNIGEVIAQQIQGQVFTGIAWQASSSTLFAITNGNGGQGEGPGNVDNSSLYTVSLTTAAATLVGETGIRAGSLSFGPDGALYAGGVGPFQGNIYRVSTATGLATEVGASGFGTGQGNGIGGLMQTGQVSPPQPPGPSSAVAIPTLGSGLFVMILLMLGVGLAGIRRV